MSDLFSRYVSNKCCPLETLGESYCQSTCTHIMPRLNSLYLNEAAMGNYRICNQPINHWIINQHSGIICALHCKYRREDPERIPTIVKQPALLQLASFKTLILVSHFPLEFEKIHQSVCVFVCLRKFDYFFKFKLRKCRSLL